MNTDNRRTNLVPPLRRHKMSARAFVTATVAAAASLVASLLVPPVGAASAAQVDRVPPIEVTKAIPVTAVLPQSTAAPATKPTPGRAPVWPAQATGAIDLASLAGAGPDAKTRVGSTGVSVRGAARTAGTLKVRTLPRDQVERISGALAAYEITLSTSLGGAAGLELEFDTRGVASAAGGDLGSRLRAVSVSASGQDGSARELSGRILQGAVTVDGAALADAAAPTGPAGDSQPTADTQSVESSSTALVALVSGASGANGAFSETPLAAASEWAARGSSGAFTWSAPITVPPVPGGLEPKLAISYASGSVDGRTASTNNQPSWVGEGFALEPGFIERRYIPCAEDMGSGANNATKTGDLCFRSDTTKSNDATWDNATLSMGGFSDALVRVGNTSTWRKMRDDGTRIQKQNSGCLSGVSSECWVVTTTDGTKYYFGLGKTSSAATTLTNSVWTVPVFGNHTGEPGFVSGSFATSSTTRPWRWNLDLVVSPTGASMSYFYALETNYYQKNKAAAASYVRGGYLTKINYGTRAGAEHSVSTPAVVNFGVAERCYTDTALTNCETATMTSLNAYHWPDVPFDQICTSSTSCNSTTQSAPTFFTRKRLATITTSARNAANTGWESVDKWTLTHSYPDPGDATSKALWLASIKQTGLAGTATDLPTTTFHGLAMDNRVDGVDNAPPLRRYRVWRIIDGYGQDLSWTYTAQQCTSTTLPTPEANTKRCFPAWYTAPGQTDPTLNWFHKYLVDTVTATDTGTSSPNVVTKYTYNGSPAWHYDESELTLPKYRTWGGYRGYESVTTAVGSASVKTTTIDTYFRGMDGDRATPTGGTKPATVTDSRGVTVTDHNRLRGALRESRSMDGTAMKSTTIHSHWISAATASDGSRTATLSDVSETRTQVALTAGGTRDTRTLYTYDPTYGDVTQVDDLGDTATTADNRCTVTTYARNTSAWIVDTVATRKTTSDPCSEGVTAANTTASEEVFYDGATSLTAAPSKGQPTLTKHLAGTTAAPIMRTTVATEYDDTYGRPTKVTDAKGRATSTSYSDAGGLNRSVTVTSADPDGSGPLSAHTQTTTVDARWGAPVKTVDANGRVTEAAVDALGRVTGVWLPGRAKATQSANQTFAYLLRSNGANAVTTNTLLPSGAYRTQIALFDGHRRSRQTQVQTLDEQSAAGTVFTETHYDSRGLAVRVTEPYFAKVAHSTTMKTALETDLPAETLTDFDALARPTLTRFLTSNTEKWRTTTSYGGDRVTVTPPAGQAPVTTVQDARGRTVTKMEYQAATPTGTTYDTTYTYDTADQLTQVQDAAGNRWTYTYDLEGKVTATSDPDAGTASRQYDEVGNLTRTVTGNGQALRHTYDALNRRTSTTDDAGTVRASWDWDVLPNGTTAKGTVGASHRHLPNGTSTAKFTQAVTALDPAGRPTSVSTTVPAVTGLIEAGLAKTYTTTTSYTLDGQTATVGLPAIANLTAETLTYAHDTLGRATTLTNGASEQYVKAAYTAYDQARQDLHGTVSGKKLYNNFSYEIGTQRLTQTRLIRSWDGVIDQTRDYTYSPAGDITKIKTASDPTVGTATDTQCLTYDLRRQLTQAWTPTSGDCATTPTAAGLGGPAPYWAKYAYDSIGNRKTETLTTPTGATSTSSYTHPAPGAGAVRPHYATSITTTNAGTGAPIPAGTRTFTPDDAGNTSSRSTPTGAVHDLDWNPEGTLGDVTDASGTVIARHVYDADGNRVLRRDTTSTTLFVGGDEITITHSTAAQSAKRHYTINGRTTAVRTGTTSSGITSLVADHHGTMERNLNNGTGVLSKSRYRMPFGATRGTALSWPDSRGYVGGVDDPGTGLTHLGAREYDPTTGTFISVDPLIDITDPVQMNGYNYANNNPLTLSDPDGLRPCADNDCKQTSPSYAQPAKNPQHPVRTTSPGVAVTTGSGSRGTASSGTTATGGRVPVPVMKQAGPTLPVAPVPGYVLATPCVGGGPWTTSVSLASCASDYATGAAAGLSKAGSIMATSDSARMRSNAARSMRAVQNQDSIMRSTAVLGRSRFVKYGGGVLAVAGAAVTYADEVDRGASVGRALTTTGFSTGGAMAGAALGAQWGATAGTFIGGPVGTVVGGAVGALAGGFIGSEAGKAFGGFVSDGASAIGSVFGWD